MDKDVVGRKNMQAFSQLTTSSIPAIEALKIDSTIAEREEDIIHPWVGPFWYREMLYEEWQNVLLMTLLMMGRWTICQKAFGLLLAKKHRKQYTVFENHIKGLIQHCERSELRLQFE